MISACIAARFRKPVRRDLSDINIRLAMVGGGKQPKSGKFKNWQADKVFSTHSPNCAAYHPRKDSRRTFLMSSRHPNPYLFDGRSGYARRHRFTDTSPGIRKIETFLRQILKAHAS